MNIENLENIQNDYNDSSKFQQLIMKFGGKDLKKIQNGLNDGSIDSKILKELYKNLYQLSEAYSFLKTNKFIHGDIKGLNLVYKMDEHKYYLIDFGFSSKFLKFSDLKRGVERQRQRLIQNFINNIYTFGTSNYIYWAKDIKITLK